MWWASHHRHHHQYSDTKLDVHSPRHKGFLWSHIGWLFCRKYAKSELARVHDFARFPEIRFVDRWHITFGEGWHNNHHRYPVATRQGLYWSRGSIDDFLEGEAC